MFSLFEEEGETLSTELAKFRFLMEKVQNPQLESVISALKVKSGLGETNPLLQRRSLPCLNPLPRVEFL